MPTVAYAINTATGIPRTIGYATPIYDQTTVLGSTVSTGVSVTLPSSGSYLDSDLEIYLNGFRLEPVTDYTYVGAGPSRTQVQFTFDLVATDRVRFRVDRLSNTKI